eukprot:3399684-Amphidinium_carterae.1
MFNRWRARVERGHAIAVTHFDPKDLPKEVPLQLAQELVSRARELKQILADGLTPIPGDTQRAAQLRALQQASALSWRAEVDSLAALAPEAVVLEALE